MGGCLSALWNWLSSEVMWTSCTGPVPFLWSLDDDRYLFSEVLWLSVDTLSFEFDDEMFPKLWYATSWGTGSLSGAFGCGTLEWSCCATPSASCDIWGVSCKLEFDAIKEDKSSGGTCISLISRSISFRLSQLCILSIDNNSMDVWLFSSGFLCSSVHLGSFGGIFRCLVNKTLTLHAEFFKCCCFASWSSVLSNCPLFLL